MMPPSSVGCESPLLNENKPRSDIVKSTQCKIKCVLIGDGQVGKTSMVVSYSKNDFPTEYVPTAYDNYKVNVNVGDQPITLHLCDTAGQRDFDTLRSLCYPDTDVFIICFSVVNPTSFQNVHNRWVPEIKKVAPETPFLLVGTQTDKKCDINLLNQLSANHLSPISTQQAEELAKRLGAKAYIETSALTQKRLKDAFDNAILCALSKQKILTNSNLTRAKKKATSGRWKRLLSCFYKQRN